MKGNNSQTTQRKKSVLMRNSDQKQTSQLKPHQMKIRVTQFKMTHESQSSSFFQLNTQYEQKWG